MLFAKLAKFSEIRAILSEENTKKKSLHQASYLLDAEIYAAYSPIS